LHALYLAAFVSRRSVIQATRILCHAAAADAALDERSPRLAYPFAQVCAFVLIARRIAVFRTGTDNTGNIRYE